LQIRLRTAPEPAPSAPTSIAHDNRRGILAMLAAMALFITGDAIMKVITASLPTPQVVALRGIVAVPLICLLAWRVAGPSAFGHALRPRLLLRGLIEISIVYLFLYSLKYLPIPIVTALAQTTPLFITGIVVVLGLETVGIRRWAAVAAGFAGVLLITRPDVSGLAPPVLSILVCALIVALRDLFTRSIPAEVPAVAIGMTSTIFVSTSGAVGALFMEWRTPTTRELLLISLMGGLVVCGNLMMIIASRLGEVSVTTPYRYAILPLGIIAGYAIWGDVPDLPAMLGMLLIAGAGLYTFHRELVRSRAVPKRERLP
jgi:drug/metabolite transporter (DMT)-like permease